MKKRSFFVINALLAAASLISFFSCSDNLDEQNFGAPLSHDGNTYLVVSAETASRAINPTAVEAKDLTALVLKGTLGSSTEETLLSAENISKMAGNPVSIKPGAWSFSLTAQLNGVAYSGTTSAQIESGKVNPISFVLSPTTEYGGMKIIVSFTGEADKVVATLKNSLDAASAIVTKEYTPADYSVGENGVRSILFNRSMEESERLSAGVYYLVFDFYADGVKNALNSCENFVRVAKGQVTSAKINWALNEVYTINYEYYIDSAKMSDAEAANVKVTDGTALAKKYSRRSDAISLPDMTLEGVKFAGWYTSTSFGESDKVTSIPNGSIGNKTLYAQFIGVNKLYVSGIGDDSNDGKSLEKALESIDRACELIIEAKNGDADWVIYVSGDVTGPHPDSTSKAGERIYSKDYGMSSISANLTTAHAKSIMLVGLTGLDSDGIPQDMLNRGLNKNDGLTGSSNDGTVLVITTEVPVTIQNLLIKNACNKNSNVSDLLSAKKGGGLYVGASSTVSLADGVVITDNGAYSGGGVYNLGTLYMYGTAAIGNKTQTATVYSNPANTSDDGGGIYNGGKLYLGYSQYVSESENMPKEWTGFIQYNYSWRGGAIKNVETGEMVMNSGTIAHNEAANNSNAYGAGIYNLGSFLMTGGTIELNRTEGSNGGGVYNANSSATSYGTFTFKGGTIKNNYAKSGYGVNGDGAGVYNNGVMYVYGDALIGDDSQTTMATNSSGESDISVTCSNLADGNGGGIYVGSSGKLYMGYSRYVDETDNTPATWNKGICYNYSKSGGGGLSFAYGSSVVVRMNSGTIANNGADKKGGAIYIQGDGLTIGGSATIPAGTEEVKQSICYSSSYSLNIADSLSAVKAASMYLIPSDNGSTSSVATGYSTYKPLITLTAAATTAGLTIDGIKEKFVVEPFTDPTTSIVTNWTVGSDGKATQKTSNLYVSASGSETNDGLSSSTPLPSITSAISKINAQNDSTKDYIITLDGEITGAQVIEDPTGGKIKANTIKIVGKSTSTSTLVDIINASGSGTGSALAIKTTVPVTLRQIVIKGGHGTQIGSGGDAKLAGGGLFLGEGAAVSFENYATVTENTAGAGAGVYISKDAKFVMNYKTKVCNNTASHYGAGIYVANGGYLKTIAGSGSDIYENSLENSDTTVTVKGGGIYLEGGATLEQLGTYVRNNSVSAGGLGSGIYMCSTANYMISGSAQTNMPNDVYMETNAQIEVVGGLNESPNARLTLASYPADGGVDVYPIKLKEGAGLSWTNSSIASCFEITPQTLGDGVTYYWYLDKNNSGKLAKKTGMGLTVSVPTGLTNDIAVTVTSDGNAVENDTRFTGGSTLVFTATSGFASYSWKLDGETQETQTAGHILTLDTTKWVKGNYVVYLEAKDAAGKYYSYTAQIKVSE
ncbi:MAG: InlB B-repeat-containing protein [Treponema sp.]|nr:InlB B-repeat-containing protein [Treponema sp.]